MANGTGMKIKRLDELDLKGKRVLVRVDYNVQLRDGVVTDDTRIRETLPTLKRLLSAGCKVVLIAHLGRPKGKPDPKYSLRPAAKELEKLLGKPVRFAEDCVGPEAEKVVSALGPEEVVLLENLRYHAEEEKNDPAFAKALAKNGEVFVQDAFGALHRAHASTAGVTQYLDGGIGFLVERELEFLDRILSNPPRPFVAVLGGAKVSDKLGVTLKLLEKVNTLIIGGAMSYTFLKAQGIPVGTSLVEDDRLEDAKKILAEARRQKVELLLPADHLVAAEVKEDSPAETTQTQAIPDGKAGVDIGPRSIKLFCERILAAKTVFWNGPMGVFEMKPFAKGSFAVAEAMAQATGAGAKTIVGGGDSLAVIKATGLGEKMSHCSTGGGASLELLEGKTLPGLAALAAKANVV